MCRPVIFYLLLIASAVVSVRSEIENPLDGKHLSVHAVEFVVSLEFRRNSTGHVIDCYGVLCHYIKVLSETLNFSYSFLIVDPKENLTDIAAVMNFTVYKLLRSEVDYVLGPFVSTPNRNQISDLAYYWYMGSYGFIVPYPSKTFDVQSILKTFTYEVWAMIIGSILAMLLYMRLTVANIILPIQKRRDTQNQAQFKKDRNINSFVLGNLVSQGQHLLSKWLFVRFAAGAWCLGCFFLVQMYSSTLTSHLMAPNQRPIANNMHELANTPGLGLTLDRGFALHGLLADIPFGDCKKLYDKIKKDPHLLCNNTDDCLKRVREKRNVAYSSPVTSLKIVMEKDLKSSGTCHYYLLKETVLTSSVTTMLQKRSPYTNRVNMEIQRFHQAGLFDKWFSDYVPNPRQCMELESQRGNQLRRLSLSHLTSAFIILGIGYSVSFFIFLFEKLVHRTN